MVEDLEEQGYLVKVVPHSHNVGTHDRCHTTVEPLIKAAVVREDGRTRKTGDQCDQDWRIEICSGAF